MEHYGKEVVTILDGERHVAPGMIAPDATKQEWQIFKPMFKEAIDNINALPGEHISATAVLCEVFRNAGHRRAFANISKLAQPTVHPP